METLSLKIFSENPHQRFINQAVEILKQGGVICYPTDTIYGLGAAINCKSAIERIYQIKKISNQKLLSFICKDLSEVAQYAYVTNQDHKILRRCLPGPFTFILPATNKTPKIIFQKRKTVGIRIPKSNLCQSLVELLGLPIISTSVPASPDEILNDPEEIQKRLGSKIDLILDGGILFSIPSTVVDLTDHAPEIIREGAGDISLVY